MIIHDQNITDGKTIMNHMNNTEKHLEFKLSEENSTTNYLDHSIHLTPTISTWQSIGNLHILMSLHNSSNHPLEHKLAAFNSYINRMLTLPITKPAKQQVWKIILTTAQNNGFPLQIIHKRKKKNGWSKNKNPQQ